MPELMMRETYSNDDAAHETMESLAESLRSDLSYIMSANAGVYRQTSDQNRRLDEMAAQFEAVKESTDQVGNYIASLEKRLGGNTTLLAISVLTNLVLLGLVIASMLHH